MIRRVSTVLHCALCIVVGAFSVTAIGSPRIAVDYQVTYQSSDFPEIHVWVQNMGDEAIPVFVSFDRFSTDQPCVIHSELDDVDSERRTRAGRIQYNVTRGIVPKNGWLHRVLRLGARGFVPGCKVQVIVDEAGTGRNSSSLNEVIIPDRKYPPYTPPSGEPKLEIDHMVEIELLRKKSGPRPQLPAGSQVLLLRTMLSNSGDKDAVFVILDRQIECKAGLARWSYARSFQRGLAIGPTSVSAGGRGFLVNVIEVTTPLVNTKCHGWMDVGYRTDEDFWSKLQRSYFVLDPEGEYEGEAGPES